jgi:4-amino-4-deoxychorismate lyase
MSAPPLTDLQLSRALHYGQGCFTTLVYRDAQPLLWDYHWQRLQQACAVLGLHCEEKILKQQLLQSIAVQAESSGIIKVMLLADQQADGYAAVPPIATQVLMVPRRLPQQSIADKRQQGCRLGLCEYRLAQQPKLAGIKHLNRLDQVLASQELLALQTDDAVMLDCAEQVIETISANIFLRIESQWLTPDLSLSGVAGVARAVISDCFQRLREPLSIRPIHWTEFCMADEVFICNAVRGIWPVVRMQQQTLAIGPFTRHLQQQLAAFF